MIRNSRRIYTRIYQRFNSIKISKIYQAYQKMRNTYNKAKDIYDKIKNYYKQFQDIYYRDFEKDKTPEQKLKEYQEQEKYRTHAYQAQQQRLKLLEEKKRQVRLILQKNKEIPEKSQERLMQQKSQAFQRYAQLRNNNTMALTTKQVEINNHLNYMLKNGFITPSQKKQMSYIQPPESRK